MPYLPGAPEIPSECGLAEPHQALQQRMGKQLCPLTCARVAAFRWFERRPLLRPARGAPAGDLEALQSDVEIADDEQRFTGLRQVRSAACDEVGLQTGTHIYLVDPRLDTMDPTFDRPSLQASDPEDWESEIEDGSGWPMGRAFKGGFAFDDRNDALLGVEHGDVAIVLDGDALKKLIGAETEEAFLKESPSCLGMFNQLHTAPAWTVGHTLVVRELDPGLLECHVACFSTALAGGLG